jgi:LysM repeat protein/uncharacterized protein YraI
MPRPRWPVLILLEAAGCLVLVAGAYALYSATAPTGLPTQAALTALAPKQPTDISQVSPTPAVAETGAFVTLHAAELPTSTPPLIVTILPTSYTVADGDTLWAIALKFNVDMDALIAANPTLNPDFLSPGETISLPATGTTPQPTSQPANARVAANAGGLRLRSGPGRSQSILTLLPAETPLTIVGRTGDDSWLQVITGSGEQGWVMTDFVELFIALGETPVTGTVVAAPTGEVVLAVPLPTPAGESVLSPFVSNLTERAREVYNFGYSYGNRPDVFSKIGDSITINTAFLAPVGYGNYNLRQYAYLQGVIDFYMNTPARAGNSFVNESLSAKGGWPTQAVLSPKSADPAFCLEGEAPLVCEYRLVRPSVAIILLGTNDVPSTPASQVERALRDVIEVSIELGVVPILTTLPPMHLSGTEGRVEEFNTIIRSLGFEYGMPVVDYWSALQGVPNDGLAGDGVHPSVAPGVADFTPDNLAYGMTVRNLVTLQALDAVWRYLLGSN